MCQVILKKFLCLNNQLSYQRRILAWSFLYENCTSLLMGPCFKNIFLPNLFWSLTIKTNWSTVLKITFFALLNIDAVSANSLSYYTAHSLVRFIKELYYHCWNFRYQLFQNWNLPSTIIYWTATMCSICIHWLFLTLVLIAGVFIAQCWVKQKLKSHAFRPNPELSPISTPFSGQWHISSFLVLISVVTRLFVSISFPRANVA